ncbi:spondin domain-containing protein [Psychrosphaera sp. F3M07]|uniref:spondin domain-containing protein n=1 Tax=Psychrosphaera sp. F3M07 TaxID=2841560 RepID=UPI001C09810A|nr:spondin domain-containing protein [Psychrosphaera sp. F3M07]MBU2918249.1 spondin domain-containing protein [Psychrosphaera sp. F3M07]
MKNFKSKYLAAFIITSSLALAGCSDDDEKEMVEMPDPEPVNVSYEVTITNLTNAQPLSPVAIVLHDTGTLWAIGEPASTALETMAEGGDNSELLALDIVKASVSGSSPLGSGATEMLTVTIEDQTDAMLSLATMLVNTNDGFTGLSNIDLSGLSVGDTWSAYTSVYDAGTESNSEAQGTIPGPADEGTGFEMARDDVDFVSMHSGVVSKDDGLTTSVLTQAHRFDNPATYIMIKRTE